MVLLCGTNYLGWSMLKWTSYECNFELAELRARSQGWPSHFGRRRALMNFAPKDTSGKLNLSFTPSFLSKQSKTLIAVGCVSYLHLLGQIRDLRPIAKTFDGAAGAQGSQVGTQKSRRPYFQTYFDDLTMIGDTSVLAGHDVVLRMIRRLRNLYGVAVIRGSKLLVGRPL